MPSKTLKTFDARSCEQWREWLARHHESESEVWLVFHKRRTGRPSIAYDDALDEALCFGWIDSLIKRLNEATARGHWPARGGQETGFEMRCTTVVVLLLLLASASSTRVHAWNAQGHRLVALIAAEHLTPVARQNVVWLLGPESLKD